MARGALSAFIAMVAAFFCFVIFNIGSILWASWRYPHNNSMAGIAGFVYGLKIQCGLWRSRFRDRILQNETSLT